MMNGETKQYTFRILVITWLVACVVLCPALSSLCASAVVFRSNKLVGQVSFDFRIVDYQYSFTVKNNSEYDIVSFKIADVQRTKKTEKESTFELHTFAIPINHAVAVPAKQSATYAPRKLIWHDCDNMVCYVYYIEFSDGTKWGVKKPAESEIPFYALTFEVPFESRGQQTTATFFPFHIQLSKADYNTCVLILAAILVIILANSFRKRGKQKKDPAEKPGRG